MTGRQKPSGPLTYTASSGWDVLPGRRGASRGNNERTAQDKPQQPATVSGAPGADTVAASPAKPPRPQDDWKNRIRTR